MGRVVQPVGARLVYRASALLEVFNQLQDWRALAFVGLLLVVPIVLLALVLGDLDDPRVEGWLVVVGIAVAVVLLIECRRQVTIDRVAGTVDERLGLPISWGRWRYGLDEFDAVVVRRRWLQDVARSDSSLLPRRLQPRYVARWKPVYEVVLDGPDDAWVRLDADSDYDAMRQLAETVAEFAGLVVLDRTERADPVE